MKYVQDIAKLTGSDEDLIRIFICFLLCYPLSLINYKLKNRNLRLLLGLIAGFPLQSFVYGFAYHTALASLVTYLFLKYFGRKISPFYLIFINFGHLSYLHIKRMYEDYGGWSLDPSVIFMMTLCKFSSIAFAYEDGLLKDEDIKSSYHREKKLTKCPTLLETFSYIFYFPTAMCGPSMEFKDFIDFIDLEGEYKNLDKKKAISAGLNELYICIFLIFIKIFVSPLFTPEYLITEDFSFRNYGFKIIYVYLAMASVKVKYFIGWKMANSIICFNGIAYNDKTKDFDKIDNCNIYKIEVEVNPKIKIQYWNRSVHLWLRNNVFLRILNVNNKYFKGNKGIASFVSFILSAFWHGFYPMYYVFFFQFYLLEQVCSMLEEKLDFFNRIKKLHWVIQQFIGLIIINFMNYLGLQFVLLTYEKNISFLKSMMFIPTIIIVLIYLYLAFFVRKPRKIQNDKTIEVKNKIE